MEQVRRDRERIPHLWDLVMKPLHIDQRLTAAYGTERVAGGAIFSNPTLDAIVKADAQGAWASKQLQEIYINLDVAKQHIANVSDERQRRCLYQFFVMGFSLTQVGRSMRCKSRQWAYTLLAESKNALRKTLRQ